MQVVACDAGSMQQRFPTTALGEVKSQGLCWDSQWGDVTPGELIQLYACKAYSASNPSDKRNQQFHLRGSVASLGGKCMSPNTDDPQDGSLVMMLPCGSSETSMTRWDYYFNP